MSLPVALGLLLVTGGGTVLGSLPVVFHHYFKESYWIFWESFGGGVMVSASIFSLFLPAVSIVQKEGSSFAPLFLGVCGGMLFIALMAYIIRQLTQNILHQRAFLFVFVMGLHNIPEGLAVGVDVAALGWRESLPLTVAIFLQNLPEGLASSMSFLISGLTLRSALLANGVTAVIETLSSFAGFTFAHESLFGLPFLLSFAGASMMSVVTREAILKIKGAEAAGFSLSGFLIGVGVCALLDLVL